MLNWKSLFLLGININADAQTIAHGRLRPAVRFAMWRKKWAARKEFELEGPPELLQCGESKRGRKTVAAIIRVQDDPLTGREFYSKYR